MGEVVYLDGAATREATAAPSLRQPVMSPVSQPERLGQVVERVLEGLTISDAHHGKVMGLCTNCGEVD